MKICLFYRVIGILILFSSNILLYSQTTAVNIVKSQEKIVIGNSTFFLHKVQAGETKYSISRIYGVKVGDIVCANIEQYSELKVGQVIKVPEIVVNVEKELDFANTDTYYWYVVEKKETIFSIAQKFFTNSESIQNINPELDLERLKHKQALKIPFPSKIVSALKIDFDSLKYMAHLVQDKETLYSLSKQYNTTKEEIERLNEKVGKEGLKAGELIILPKLKMDTMPISKPIAIQSQTSQLLAEEPILSQSLFNVDSCSKYKSAEGLNSINMVMLLPLFSNLVEQSDENDDKSSDDSKNSKSETKFNPTSTSFIEFYNGALLALNKYKGKGLSINLKLFDTESGKAFQQILTEAKLSEADLIIGPAFSDQMKLMMASIDSDKIVVSPVSDKGEILKGNKSVSMIVPPVKVEEKHFVKMMQRHKDKNIIVVHPNDIQFYNKSASFRNHLSQMGEDSSRFFADYAITNFDMSNIAKYIQYDKENVLAIPVNDEAFVNSVILSMRNFMIAHPDSYKFTILGMSEWLNYKTIDIETLFTYGYQYVTTFHFNHNDTKVKAFYNEFNRLFQYEPLKMASIAGYNYAMLGYDVVDYYLSFMIEYGKRCQQCIVCHKKEGVNTNFNFERYSESDGAFNSSFQYIRFLPDYTIDKELMK